MHVFKFTIIFSALVLSLADPAFAGSAENTLDFLWNKPITHPAITKIFLQKKNKAPKANAGKTQQLTDDDNDGKEAVQLDGSESEAREAGASIISYSWSEEGEKGELATGVRPTVELPVGKTTIVLTVTDDNQLTDTDKVNIHIKEAKKKDNKAPKAHAGKDQELTDDDNDGKETVQLDGSKSEAREDGASITSYSWSVEGSTAELATGVTPTVELPVGKTAIILTVTDSNGSTDSAKVNIHIKEGKRNDDDDDDDDDDEEDDDDDDEEDDGDDDDDDDDDDDEQENQAPEARAGENQQLTDNDGDGKETVQLDGSGSEDKDGSIVSYQWSIEGTSAVLATGVSPTVELPVGNTTIVLTVTDDGGLTATDRVEISIQDAPNKTPVADAGDDQVLTDTDRDGEEPVTLNGSGSSDEDGSIESYSWSVNGTEIATGINPSVVLPVGSTTLTLTVTDNEGATATDNVLIRVNEAENIAPVANAGEDQQLTDTDGDGEEPVTLNGSGSEDPDGTIAGYSWSVEGNEIATGGNPTVTLPVGSYTVVLTVTDNEGSTDTDEVAITINAAANEAPVADAGPDQVLTDDDNDGKETVQLDGSGSGDRDGSIVSYLWRLEGSDTELATGVNPIVELPLGNTTIVLTVTDDGGLTATDRVTISIQERGDDNGGGDGDSGDGDGGDDDGGNDDDGGSDDGGDNGSGNGDGGNDDGGSDDGGSDDGGDDGGGNDDDGGNGDGGGNNDGGDNGSGNGDEGNDDGGSDDGNNDGGSDEEDDGSDDNDDGEPAGTAFLPNLFSPNGDQMNDAFILHCTNVQKIHWRIYNRQGRLVYETQDLEEATQTGWDGTAFGAPQPEGSYVWVLEGIYTDGTPVLIEGDIKGSVTLIR